MFAFEARGIPLLQMTALITFAGFGSFAHMTSRSFVRFSMQSACIQIGDINAYVAGKIGFLVDNCGDSTATKGRLSDRNRNDFFNLMLTLSRLSTISAPEIHHVIP